MMGKKRSLPTLSLVFLVLFGGGWALSATAAPTPRTVNGFLSSSLSALSKRLWSMKSSTRAAISGRSMMKFESGYSVETVFDGSKVGIEPYAVEVTSSGELLVLDSVNSNLYRMPSSLSRYSRPKLVAGSTEGYAGHIDGRPREARMNNPKGLTVDDRGNIYVADTMNMAIRKISDSGVTTIAGGKWNKGGHVDGPSEDAKFSNDFEVVYVGSSCSLLVIDRGNQAIREIQLNFDDCAYQYGSGFPLGIIVLLAAGFFGYMLALLQRQVGAIVSSKSAPVAPPKASFSQNPYQKPAKRSVRPPLIPPEDGSTNQDEEKMFPIGRLLSGVGLFFVELFGGAFSVFKRKPQNHPYQNQFPQQPRHTNAWPMQDSYVVPQGDEPPPPETRTPTPQKTYAFMAKDSDKIRHIRQGQSYFGSWDGELQQHHHQQHQQPQQMRQQHLQQQRQQPQQMRQQHLQQQRSYSLGPQTYYEQSYETTKEIVFGAVQESDSTRTTVEIKPVNYSDPLYDQGLRSRISYTGYHHAY